MRRFLFVLPLIASAIAMPGSARGVENLDRNCKFAEDTFDTTIQRIKRRLDKAPARIKLTLQ